MSPGTQLAIALVIGGGLGIFVGWLLGSRKQTMRLPMRGWKTNCAQQLTQRESELTQIREQLSQTKTSACHRAGKSGGGGENSCGAKAAS